MKIHGSKELIEYLLLEFPKRLTGANEEHNFPANTVVKKVFKDYTFSGSFGIFFKDCKFINCRFENTQGFFCLFANCKFLKTTFIDSWFSHFEEHWYGLEFNQCYFTRVRLDEGTFLNIVFNDCHFDRFNMGGFYAVENTWFRDCYITASEFCALNFFNNEKYTPSDFPDIVFEKCIIDGSGFNHNDLRYCMFNNTILYESSFVDCQLMANTIIKTEKLRFENKASIDLQTILKSEDLDPDILVHYFNINDRDIKTIIGKVTNKVEYKKIFISFSFKDKKFADRLYAELCANGIRAFFWVIDAPPGRQLEDIMTTGIRGHDKTLFIASENSLKSPACQYELSESRKKQAETWEDIIFPLHIDDFLFQVQKSQIRPIDRVDEYWANIEEIRRVNSTDMSAFNKDRIDKKKFKEAVIRIVRELKLETNVIKV